MRGKSRTNNIRDIIIRILETRDEPMTAAELAYAVESQTRYRCGVFSIPNVLRPQITDGIVRRIKPVGFKVYTYELI